MSTLPGTGLIYLVGPSGSGKDTVLRHLGSLLREREPVLIAHRYITRDSDANEASIALTPVEFARRQALGCFALHWQSHGLSYGVGIEIEAWLRDGATVLVNGSRAHLAEAFARYPGLHAVQISVVANVLARRLALRARESEEQIAERLARATLHYPVPQGCVISRLDNSGPPQVAAAALLNRIRTRIAA